MKKLILVATLSIIAFNLKAQSTPGTIIVPKIQLLPYYHPSFKSETSQKKPDLLPGVESDNAIVTRKNGVLIAKLDHMPIAEPKGNWKTPVLNPGNLNNYKMPVVPGLPKRNDTVKIMPVQP